VDEGIVMTTASTAREPAERRAASDVELLPTFLTTEEVASLLRVNPSTVCRWRLAGSGPRVTWLSAKIPRYQKADVLEWVSHQAS
jgi:hypothetical protein